MKRLECWPDCGGVPLHEDGAAVPLCRRVGGQIDLSCGRIELWSGAPMIGPAPGLGILRDCDP